MTVVSSALLHFSVYDLELRDEAIADLEAQARGQGCKLTFVRSLLGLASVHGLLDKVVDLLLQVALTLGIRPSYELSAHNDLST